MHIYMYLSEEVVVAMATGEACVEEGEDVGAALAEQLSELLTPSVAKMERAVVNLAREAGQGGREAGRQGRWELLQALALVYCTQCFM